MNNLIEYNRLELSGSLLVPGFSIYLLEIIFNNEKWFYIGMTGDPFYPSARAAFHRISGHLELSKHSTQNQLMLALQDKGIKDDTFHKLSIIMHHYPINGFNKWPFDDMKAVTIKSNQNTSAYIKYKKIQQKVETLEDALIFNLRKNKINILNKTLGQEIKFDKEYKPIFDDIIKKVNV